VSTALHLSYNICACAFPEALSDRLLHSSDQRITGGDVLFIKAQRYRSQDGNREDAVAPAHLNVGFRGNPARTAHGRTRTFLDVTGPRSSAPLPPTRNHRLGTLACAHVNVAAALWGWEPKGCSHTRGGWKG